MAQIKITSKPKIFTTDENEKFAYMIVNNGEKDRTPYNVGYSEGLKDIDVMLDLTRLAKDEVAGNFGRHEFNTLEMYIKTHDATLKLNQQTNDIEYTQGKMRAVVDFLTEFKINFNPIIT